MDKLILCKDKNLVYNIMLPNKQALIKSFLQTGYYTSGVRTYKNPIDISKIEPFLRDIYTTSYNNIKKTQETKHFSKSVQDALDKYLSNPNFIPENMSNKDIFNLGSTVSGKGLGNLLNNPNAQAFIPFLLQDSDYNYIKGVDDNGKSIGYTSTFIHVLSHRAELGTMEPKQVRLYLNLPTENIDLFIREFYNKCSTRTNSKNEKLYPYFKFANGGRNDQFLLFTSYANTPQYISIFEEIKAENPELCKGCEEMDQNLGSINGWIGFGECTKQDHIHSYSSLREDAIGEFIQIIKNNPQKYGPINKVDPSDPTIIKLFDKVLLEHEIDPSSYVLNANSKLKMFVCTPSSNNMIGAYEVLMEDEDRINIDEQ